MENNIDLTRLIRGIGKRDAVHIAVCPVIAGENLKPGQHVGFDDSGDGVTVISKTKKFIGIISPFLNYSVSKRQKCWMMLYPNTITSLRHEWTHPDIPYVLPKLGREFSQKWLEEFAKDADISLSELLIAAKNYIIYDDYLCDEGKWEGFSTPDEFWTHYEIVTGEKVDEDNRGNFFTCSC